MIPLLSVLVILALSILVTRIATVALTHTGISRESARFQARSAFTGVGFTTSEAEQMVNHPVRRRIVIMLMLVGSGGIVSMIASLFLTILRFEGLGSAAWIRVGLLVAGIGTLWVLGSSDWLDRWVSRLIERALSRWTDLDELDSRSTGAEGDRAHDDAVARQAKVESDQRARDDEKRRARV